MRLAGVQSIANWNFPEMRARLASWTVRAITSYPQVLASAREAGLISAADADQLLRFYADPRGHSWNVADRQSEILCPQLMATLIANNAATPITSPWSLRRNMCFSILQTAQGS
jgi:hypothetical protein